MAEQTNESLQTELFKANKVINKLQAELGAARGEIALVETERDMYLNYIQQQQEKDAAETDIEEVLEDSKE